MAEPSHEQAALPLMTPMACCLRCNGTGDVYYLASRPEVIGGRRALCPDCDGAGWVGGFLR